MMTMMMMVDTGRWKWLFSQGLVCILLERYNMYLLLIPLLLKVVVVVVVHRPVPASVMVKEQQQQQQQPWLKSLQ